MSQLKIILPLILILTTSFTSVFADDNSLNFGPKSFQELLVRQITSLFHLKSGYMPIELSKAQVVEYSIISAIVLIVIIVIASSVRSKNKKPIRK
ncbi:MAG TPA: hypothetical protein VFP45_07530 [Candidatus Nitrosotalea sp.]|nr:hypothetical protein [Candidatus Nitrosotalea sp.]